MKLVVFHLHSTAFQFYNAMTMQKPINVRCCCCCCSSSSSYFQDKILDGKILKTKQVRPQRRLLGGKSAVEGDRISPLDSH